MEALEDENSKQQDFFKSIVPTKTQKEEEEEPILKENPNRFVLFPIKYHSVY